MGKKRHFLILAHVLLFLATLCVNTWVCKAIAGTKNGRTVIEHMQLEFFVPGKRIQMQANISDPAGIAEARLYFGTHRGIDGQVKNLVYSEMNPQGGRHVGIIPAPSSETDAIFYALLAVNYNGDVAKTGFFELHASKNIGFVPTWQEDLDKYGETLVLGRETTSSTSDTPTTTQLEGFADSLIVNTAKPEEKYFAVNKVQWVAGLSTADGGDPELELRESGQATPSWSTKKKAVVAGGSAAAVGGIIAAVASGGGGGGGGGCKGLRPPCEGIIDSIDVPAPVGVEWTATKDAPWIAFRTSRFGTGPGTVEFLVTPNTGTTRTGRIDIKRDDTGGRLRCMDITQVGGCTTTTTSTTVTTTSTTTSTTSTTLPNVPGSTPTDGVDGTIDFDPTTGQVGDPVSVSICFNGGFEFAETGWHLRVIDNTNGKRQDFSEQDVCGPECGPKCSLGQIFKFSDSNHEIRIRINTQLSSPEVTIFEASVPLELQ